MNELIKINFEQGDRPTVSGRGLHTALKINTRYNDWFNRMCDYGFTEGVDFYSFLSKSTGGRPETDHELTITMAKEICMLQRTEIGRQFRQYFIAVEEQWNRPEAVMARALQLANVKLKELQDRSQVLEAKIEEDKPKVLFADTVAGSSSSILIGDLAKILKQKGVNMGQNRLFQWLRDNGYLIKRKGSDYNTPTQYSMELGLFEIRESTVSRPDGGTLVRKTPKVTGKGQIYFINKLTPNENETF